MHGWQLVTHGWQPCMLWAVDVRIDDPTGELKGGTGPKVRIYVMETCMPYMIWEGPDPGGTWPVATGAFFGWPVTAGAFLIWLVAAGFIFVLCIAAGAFFWFVAARAFFIWFVAAGGFFFLLFVAAGAFTIFLIAACVFLSDSLPQVLSLFVLPQVFSFGWLLKRRIANWRTIGNIEVEDLTGTRLGQDWDPGQDWDKTGKNSPRSCIHVRFNAQLFFQAPPSPPLTKTLILLELVDSSLSSWH